MEEHELILKVKTETPDEARQLLTILQALVNDFGPQKILSMFNKLQSNPGLMKNAAGFLNFI